MNQANVLREFYFSKEVNHPILDSQGKVIGRLRDMAVRWIGASPVVTNIKYGKGIDKHVNVTQVDYWDDKGIVLKESASPLATHLISEDEFYMGKWLLDKQIIDLQGSKLVRVNDIKLSLAGHGEDIDISLVAVDIGIRGFFRRLGCEFLFRRFPEKLLSWQVIAPLESKVSNLQLTRNMAQINEMHIADIADILKEMDYRERVGLMSNLDDEIFADVLTEVDLDTQLEIIEGMDYQRVSDILEEMPADEAADILGELPEDQSHEILKLMEHEDAEDVRELMRYSEDTVGALMTTEYIAFPGTLTAAGTIDQLRQMAPEAETIYYIYVVDESNVLQGVLSLRELIIASPEVTLADIMHKRVIAVNPLADQSKALNTVIKYNLLAVPVTNEHNVILGIVTIDDVVDAIKPDRSHLRTFSRFMIAGLKGETK